MKLALILLCLFVENNLKSLEYEFTEPSMADSDGAFLSHSLHYEISQPRWTRNRLRRETDSIHELTYYLTIGLQKSFYITLQPNNEIYSPNLVIEERLKNKTNAKESFFPHCYFTGHVKGDLNSKVALSTCHGLVRQLLL